MTSDKNKERCKEVAQLPDTLIAIYCGDYLLIGLEFMEHEADHLCEIRTKEVGIVKTTHTSCDEAYKTRVSCVNGFAILQGETAYATFINNVIVIIRRRKGNARRPKDEECGEKRNIFRVLHVDNDFYR